jgi:hypothetical protein
LRPYGFLPMVQESLATTIQFLAYDWTKAPTSCQRMLPGPFRASLSPSYCLLLAHTLRLTHFCSLCCAASSLSCNAVTTKFLGHCYGRALLGGCFFAPPLTPRPPTPPPLVSAASLHPHESLKRRGSTTLTSPPTSSSFNNLFCSATVSEESSLQSPFFMQIFIAAAQFYATFKSRDLPSDRCLS